MIGEQKIVEIAQKLLEKSKNDEVVWKEMSLGSGSSCYFVQFPESRLTIAYQSPTTEPDKIYISIENKDGKAIGDVYVVENEEDRRWSLMRELYDEADRYVRGWDKTLTEIEKELQKEGSIGR